MKFNMDKRFVEYSQSDLTNLSFIKNVVNLKKRDLLIAC